jgi:DNA-binding NtrC family response regulator
MARRRSHASELVKLLESAAQPLYVLDDELVIVYLNEACREWLGPGADALVGRQCRYDSGGAFSGPDAIAAGLCPPPTVLEGREVSARVTRLAAGQTFFRRARFLPLGQPNDSIFCIVALVDADDGDPEEITDQSPPTAASEVDEAQELHERLLRFRRRAATRFRAGRLVGVTNAIRRARAQAEVAAACRASVLLVGPKGSGRRHLAEAIHYSAPPESCGKLVPLECGLLDAEMVDATIRAAAARKTDAGTLLLCDADRLSAEGQAAVASVLQSATFPLRAISTATAPLVDLPSRGLFREDLAALLSTITIELPPLAARREDLPLLAQALLEEINARGVRQLGGFKPDALDRLSAYAWPGNVNELAEVVAESHARASGPLIAYDDLPERLRLAAEAVARSRRKDEPIQLDEFVARIERELIRRALARAKGNKAKAARLLGLNRPRLYRRMVQLGLAKEGEIEN